MWMKCPWERAGWGGEDSPRVLVSLGADLSLAKALWLKHHWERAERHVLTFLPSSKDASAWDQDFCVPHIFIRRLVATPKSDSAPLDPDLTLGSGPASFITTPIVPHIFAFV